MQRSTGTIRSQDRTGLNQSTIKAAHKQRTATSNRTGLLSSAQTSSGPRIVEKQKPRIIDDDNVDVTPKPLFDLEAVTKNRLGSALFQSIEGISTPTEVLSNGSILNSNAILTGAQSLGGYPESSSHVSSESMQHPSDSIQEPSGEKERELSAFFYTSVDKKTKKGENHIETLTLTETPTFCLLDISTICISEEDSNGEIASKVRHNNEKYIELCKTKLGNDSFVDRGINTFNDPPKLKSTQTDRITINEKGILCTEWDMYDSMEKEVQDEDTEDLIKNLTAKAAKSNENSTSMSKTKASVGVGTITATVASEFSGNASEHALDADAKHTKRNSSNYQESDNFKLNAFYMERLLNQNTYQPKQAKYRGLKPLAEEVSKDQSKLTQQYDGLTLEKLWTYTCHLTKDRNVSCISWNKKNKDILAVGYGKFEYNDEQSGLVCCWCLKNPEFPERYYKTDSGVTALAFSQKHANLLAVGLFNGSIQIYDVRNNNTVPLLSTNESDHKHLSPVWHLKWTDRDRANSNGDDDEMEVLMSISSDGRVTQWMIRKGFESSDYLKLKRIMSKGGINPKKDKDKSEGLISRHSGGLCFDIWDQDKSIYLCGTEEGFIHRCSTSYNEQYLDTYQGHTGPIYKIAWSPFLKNCFLSASSDWTVRLWKTNRFTPCLTFNSSTKAVFDICWSNHSATLFCCVNENAIELWDLSKSTLDPIYITNPIAPTKLTSISYSPNSDSLIVGTNDGSLWVYAIKNLPPPTKNVDLDEIIKQSLISQLESVRIDEDEAKEVIEKHQLESLAINQQQSNEDNRNQEDNKPQNETEQKEKMDAFVAKLDKIKTDNAAMLDAKKTLKIKKPKIKNKNNATQEEDEDSSDSDDEKNNQIISMKIQFVFLFIH